MGRCDVFLNVRMMKIAPRLEMGRRGSARKKITSVGRITKAAAAKAAAAKVAAAKAAAAKVAAVKAAAVKAVAVKAAAVMGWIKPFGGPHLRNEHKSLFF